MLFTNGSHNVKCFSEKKRNRITVSPSILPSLMEVKRLLALMVSILYSTLVWLSHVTCFGQWDVSICGL